MQIFSINNLLSAGLVIKTNSATIFDYYIYMNFTFFNCVENKTQNKLDYIDKRLQLSSSTPSLIFCTEYIYKYYTHEHIKFQTSKNFILKTFVCFPYYCSLYDFMWVKKR